MPLRTLLSTLSILVLLSTPAVSQQVLTGKIRQKTTDAILTSVTVVNHTQGKHNISDAGGNYRIMANPGDTITFSSAGYHADTTYVVTSELEDKDGYIVYLEPNLVELPSVLVGQLSNYQLDSMQRKEDYAWLGQTHKVRLAGDQTPTDGVGIGFSPVTYFSSEQKDLRQLRQRVKSEEKDFYIDSRFPSSYVSMVTGLKGDSLQLFMVTYRPGYKFCRNASNEDILLYINEKLKLFQKTYLEHPMFAAKQN
jgi:CarboxypepD_reg-like domain